MFIRSTNNIGRGFSRVLFFVGFLFLTLFFSPQSVFAATGNIDGFAWGGGVTSNPPGYDGIGWISMNSSDCDADDDRKVDNAACGAIGSTIASYGVTIPSTNGDLSGYAWSEHYGWISFNPVDVVGCPSVSCNARRVGDMLAGWARIISICDTGNAGNGHTRDGRCDANDDGVNAGGWSGWISLSDINSGGSGAGYGVNIFQMTKNGANPTYAYSDELGWIDFSRAGFQATLKICPNRCNLNGTSFNGRTFSSIPTTLYACYGTGDCSDPDTNVSGTWTESNPTLNAIRLDTHSGASTNVSNTYVGTTFAEEDITLSYTPPSGSPLSVTATAHVSCVSNYSTLCDAEKPKYCPTESISIVDRCGHKTGDFGYSCNGTRNCDYNWKEAAP